MEFFSFASICCILKKINRFCSNLRFFMTLILIVFMKFYRSFQVLLVFCCQVNLVGKKTLINTISLFSLRCSFCKITVNFWVLLVYVVLNSVLSLNLINDGSHWLPMRIQLLEVFLHYFPSKNFSEYFCRNWSNFCIIEYH